MPLIGGALAGDPEAPVCAGASAATPVATASRTKERIAMRPEGLLLRKTQFGNMERTSS
jgi:hypothetical protein